MRIRFFTPVQQLPIATPKHVDEETIEEASASSSEMEDSTAGEDSNLSLEMNDVELTMFDSVDMPEMDNDTLKRLLLSPLEPEMEF